MVGAKNFSPYVLGEMNVCIEMNAINEPNAIKNVAIRHEGSKYHCP